jgi:hypothetical protein
VANILALYDMATIMDLKSFTVQAQGGLYQNKANPRSTKHKKCLAEFSTLSLAVQNKCRAHKRLLLEMKAWPKFRPVN